MASIAMMIGGAILNAAAFTGGNYLAKFLAGDGSKATLDEKTRHDKALEAYQSAIETFSIRQTPNRKLQTAVKRLQFRVAKISNFSKAFSSVHFYLAKI